MRTRLWTTAVTVAAIAATVLFLTIGSPRSGPATPARSLIPVSVPPPDPAVDFADPAAVCRAFATALFARDTVSDHGPGDSYIRAAAYASPAFAEALAIPVRQALPGWDTWTAHRAKIAVDATVVHGDADTASSSTIAITATPTSADGWTGTPSQALVYCTATSSGGRYLVTGYGIEPR